MVFMFQTEIALLLLEQEPSLGSSVDKSGITCLQQLANMQSAFKRSYPVVSLKRILYFCMVFNDFIHSFNFTITSSLCI